MFKVDTIFHLMCVCLRSLLLVDLHHLRFSSILGVAFVFYAGMFLLASPIGDPEAGEFTAVLCSHEYARKEVSSSLAEIEFFAAKLGSFQTIGLYNTGKRTQCSPAAATTASVTATSATLVRLSPRCTHAFALASVHTRSVQQVFIDVRRRARGLQPYLVVCI